MNQLPKLESVLLDREHAQRCLLSQTRRKFLTSAVGSLGSFALGSMTGSRLLAAPANPMAGMSQFPNHLARAKRVIHLCMAGGPSHLESFDYKPELERQHGNTMPESITAGQPIAQLQGKALTAFRPQTTFQKCGQSGIEISDFFPNIQTLADDICVIKSMVTDQINHDPAHTFFNTGTIRPNYPSIGSWLLYGLGSMNENLPGYVVLTSVGGGQAQPISARQWSSGFLAGKYQGVKLNSTGDPVYYVARPTASPRLARPNSSKPSTSSTRITPKSSMTPVFPTASPNMSSPSACRWQSPNSPISPKKIRASSPNTAAHPAMAASPATA